jgi:hypothetical protein
MIPKFIKMWFYQILANSLIKKLEKTKDDKRWSSIYATAMGFNSWCIEQDIYLK